MRKSLLVLALHCCFATNAHADLVSTPLPLEHGFKTMSFVSDTNRSHYEIPKGQENSKILDLCDKLKKEFARYGWLENPCAKVNWQAQLQTAGGDPLIYATFGEGKDVTLILGGVHPDELNPVHLAFRFARYLAQNPATYQGKNQAVVVAPLVNPTGFLLKRPTRTNTNHVDLNRNFLTHDWYDHAFTSWQKRKDQRYFPGFFPNSEIETIFQIDLIDRLDPSKILSLHAPLGFLDYDGPGDQKTSPSTHVEGKAKEFAKKVAEKSHNYRIVDYSFYPGSLGNYAGNERGVPTLTLEFETKNPTKVDDYWEKFLPGFIQSITYTLR